MRRRMSLCLLLSGAFLALGSPAHAKVFDPTVFTLENGLTVVVVENHRAPIVSNMVWYKVGAADEQRGTSGIAHFLEHLMFKGTPAMPPGDFSKKIRALGGNDNAFTHNDYTAYYQSISTAQLETVMRMEADRMNNLAPPASEFASEHKVIMEERRQNTESDPGARFSEEIRAALFPNHPYGTPIIGWMSEIEGLTWADAKAFYDTHYAPNNAILVVSGDVTEGQLKPLAEKIYGALPKEEVPPRHWSQTPPLQSDATLTMHDPQVREPTVQTVARAPSYAQNRDESLALQVLEEIMSGGPTTRLYKTLAVDAKLVNSAGIGYAGGSIGDGTITSWAVPLPGVAMDKVEAALNEQLHKVAQDGVTEQELADAKKRMQAGAIYARDSLTGPAMIFGRTLVAGGTVDDVEFWPQKIEAVTSRQVQDVAKKYLDPQNDSIRTVTGYLLPEEPKPAPAETPETKTPATEKTP